MRGLATPHHYSSSKSSSLSSLSSSSSSSISMSSSRRSESFPSFLALAFFLSAAARKAEPRDKRRRFEVQNGIVSNKTVHCCRVIK